MDKNNSKRDVTEAMQIFDSLPPELQEKALTFMRLVLADDTEKNPTVL